MSNLTPPPATIVRVGCDVVYESAYPTPMLLVVRPQNLPEQHVLSEQQLIEPATPSERLADSFGNRLWRMVAPSGLIRLHYDALVKIDASTDPVLPDLTKTPVEHVPGDVLMYILPSRYCQSDLLMAEAWRLFGNTTGGWPQVQAVCDWIHTNIAYASGSTSTTTSLDVYEQGRGVCRDFAHLAITFCRALNIPARYVCGYLPEIGVEPDPAPMDFHAWFEVFLDGAWRTFDARHNRPRIGRIKVATGRDAVDVAWATIYGNSQLKRMHVWAEEVDAQTTLDQGVAIAQAKV